MKLLISSLIVLASVNAWSYDADAVKKAEVLYKSVDGRYQKGEVTSTDVYQTEKYVLDMKLFAKTITAKAYCSQVIPLQKRIVSGIKEEEKVGQRTIKNVIEVEQELSAIIAGCSQI